MDFEKVERILKSQGRRKDWFMTELGTYPMEYHRVKKHYKEVPVSWGVKIPEILCCSINDIK